MKKILQVLNGVAFVSTVIINYLSNTGALNNTTIGKISRGLNSLFTPAGYAFSIWGLIYILLFGFIIYQARGLFVKVKDDHFVEKTGVWFILSCLLNSAWVFAWIYEYTALSCLFIFGLLFALLKIVLNNNIQVEKTSKAIQYFVGLPFTIYSGWVTVASVANVSSYLVKIDWNGFGLSNQFWTILMINIAVLINVIILYTRKMYGFALVGAWALIAIGIANSNKENTIDTVSFVAAAILISTTITYYINNKKAAKTIT